jgi:hypothetical protein
MSCTQGPLTVTLTWREGATHNDSGVHAFGESVKHILQRVADGSIHSSTQITSLSATDQAT